ncbi:hypothetical protein [Paraflavitalea speifideaquila]|uniref:hypothetical protein n=1 Tax=Paraflavitalea speifideaquila TaxID=3076558 RepID=UPI0028E6A428|nr:hypothetical protein [Paraflavitalea speifideiaquila]
MIATSSRSTFSGAGGIRPDATATFSISVVPAKGPDIFVYTNTVTRIIDGNASTTTTTTTLNPEDSKSAKGVTKGRNIYFDGLITESRNNKDWETVGKFMNLDKGFYDYMVARNPRAAGWRAKALSIEAGEFLLPVLVQSGLGAYGGFRLAGAQSMRLAGFGDDAAITSNMANLTPKKGWYDVVVHGTEDGLAFTVNKQLVTPNQLYNMMLANGYQQGTKIRLMSCYSGSVPGGGAVQLSKLANAPVMAPTGALSIFGKGSFMVNYGQQFYIEPTQAHEIGRMLLFK